MESAMEEEKKLDSLDPADSDEKPTEEPMNRKEWFGLFRYFIGGLAVAVFFFFMMASGPKGVLAGGVSIFAGLLVWIVYRFVFREVD